MDRKSGAFIKINQLGHTYAPAGAAPICALRDVTLDVHEGEFVAIVGANGSGKSTLARHLNALLLPSQGDVWVDGLNTRDLANHRSIRAQVGMVFQIPIDQIVATIAQEDVAFGPENLGVPQPELGERVREALERVGMWAWRERPPHMLSPGQQQRLAIAGVLAMRPRCLVLDEATAMLDPRGRRDLWAIVDDLRRNGLTILFITHDMDDASRAERVIALAHGEIALDGAPDTVFSCEDELRSIGLSLPTVPELAARLRKRYPTLPGLIFSLDALTLALEGLPS